MNRVLHAGRAALLFAFSLSLGLGGAVKAADITLSNPTGSLIYQRSDANVASVRIEGDCSEGVTTVMARAVPRSVGQGTETPWTTIDNTSGGFSGALTLPVGWYDLEVKSYNGSNWSTPTVVPKVGVGEVFITAGQSNTVNSVTGHRMVPTDERVLAGSYESKSWRLAYDGQPIPAPSTNAYGGSVWPAVGSDLVAGFTIDDRTVDGLDMPVGFLAVGVGGTKVEWWLPGAQLPRSHYDDPSNVPNFLFDRLESAIEFLEPTGFRAILWHQGETDARKPSAEHYAENLTTLIEGTRAYAESVGYADSEIPWFVSTASFWYSNAKQDPSSPDYDPTYNPIDPLLQAEQQSVVDNVANVYAGPNTDLLDETFRRDGVHFNANGQIAVGLLWADAIRAVIQPVPEPSSIALALFAAAGLLPLIRRRNAC